MGRSGNSGQSGQWALSGLSGQWGLPKQSNLSGLSGLSDSGRTSRPHISYIDVTTYFFLTYSTSSRTLFSVREYYKFVGDGNMVEGGINDCDSACAPEKDE